MFEKTKNLRSLQIKYNLIQESRLCYMSFLRASELAYQESQIKLSNITTLVFSENKPRNGFPVIWESKFKELYKAESSTAFPNQKKTEIATFNFQGYTRDRNYFDYKDVMVTNGLLRNNQNEGINVITEGFAQNYSPDDPPLGPNSVKGYEMRITIPRDLQDELGIVVCSGICYSKTDAESFMTIEENRDPEGIVLINTGFEYESGPKIREIIEKIHYYVVDYITQKKLPLNEIQKFVYALVIKLKTEKPTDEDIVKVTRAVQDEAKNIDVI